MHSGELILHVPWTATCDEIRTIVSLAQKSKLTYLVCWHRVAALTSGFWSSLLRATDPTATARYSRLILLWWIWLEEDTRRWILRCTLYRSNSSLAWLQPLQLEGWSFSPPANTRFQRLGWGAVYRFLWTLRTTCSEWVIWSWPRHAA